LKFLYSCDTANDVKLMRNLETTRVSNSDSALWPGGVLQRKCDCGNHTVAGGECAECGKKKTSLQHSQGEVNGASTHSFFDSRFRQDFSHIPVRNFPATREINQPAPLFDGIGELELGHTDCDWKRDVAEEVFIPNSDKTRVSISNTEPCTRECTSAHENVHITQVQPICKDYYTCFEAAKKAGAKSNECKDFKGADHAKCVDLVSRNAQFECFEKVANRWDPMKWECEAYKKSLECAKRLQATVKKDCSGKLGSYIYNATKSIDKYCKTEKDKTEAAPPQQPDKPAQAPPKKE
jgi:hypothetical protein